MEFSRTARSIVFWITCSICVSLARPEERHLEWMTQVIAFLEPISPIVDAECRNHTLGYLEAAKNLSNFWAINMMDATAKFPPGILSGNIRSMGSFDQCLRVKHPEDEYVGKYCLAKLKYSTYGTNEEVLQDYIDLVTAGRRLLELDDEWVNGTLILPIYSSSEWAVCLPSTCSTKDVEILTRDAIRRATLDVGLQVTVLLEDDLCYSESTLKSNPFEGIDYFITCIFVTMIIMAIFGSAWCQIPSVQKRNGVAVKILRAFSVPDNWKQLTNFRPPSKDAITCLEGIRTLSTLWVVVTHEGMLVTHVPYINKLETIKTHDVYGYYAIWNSLVNVDTFLLVSGLLRGYNLIKELALKDRGNFLYSSVQRYLRLTPTYLMVICFYVTFFDRLDSGPAWKLYVGRSVEACRKYWWHNLLYINNYIPHNDKCVLQSWYLAADMQLFLIAPLLIYPMWKWKILGRVLMTVAMIVSVMLPFATTWINEFPGTIMLTASNSVLNTYGRYLYMATHDRMSPYFVGLLLGYVFHHNKSTDLPKWKIAAGWTVSLVVMYACVYGAKNMTSFHHDYDLWEAALYGGLHRFAWAVAVAWVVFACHFGYGGPVNTFLSCSVFRFLGRLSYCIFLTHLAVLLYNAAVLQVPRQLHLYISIRDFMGDFVIIFFVSLLLYIFIELPMYGVTKEILKKK